MPHPDIDGDDCAGTPETEPGGDTLRCPDCGAIWDTARQTLIGHGTPMEGAR